MNLSTFNAFKHLNNAGIGITVEGEMLKKCQKVILRILEDVIALCEKENICYQLSGGTALGAVREHGFIAWDDDIDMNVHAGDIERLRELIIKNYPDKYTFADYRIKNYGLPMIKIMLNNTIFRDRESYSSEHCGFFIDIFPIENVPDNPILRKIHGCLCMVSGGLLSCRKFFMNRKLMLKLAEKNPGIKSVVRTKILIGGLISFLPLSTWAKITNYLYGLCKNESSKYVSIPSGKKHYFGEMYLREGMMNTIKMPFEGHQWNVAKDYDNYMKVLYGPDYMIPSPPDKREHHVLLELKFPEEM